MIDLASLRVGFAFSLGMATFFAPCALPLLPGYVAYFVGRESDGATVPLASRLRTAVVVALLTSLGFFVVLAVLFGIFVFLGSQILANVGVLELVVGSLLVVLGTVMALGKMDRLSVHVRLPERRRGPLAYFGFGVIYAAAAAGCTGPVFVGVASLGIGGTPAEAAAIFGSFAAGMSVLMIGVTLFAAAGRDALVRYLVSNTGLVTRLAGVALVVAGLVQIYWFLFVFDGIHLFT